MNVYPIRESRKKRIPAQGQPRPDQPNPVSTRHLTVSGKTDGLEENSLYLGGLYGPRGNAPPRRFNLESSGFFVDKKNERCNVSEEPLMRRPLSRGQLPRRYARAVESFDR